MDNVTLVKITSNDLYKAVKNYLHNDLGMSSTINREYIDKVIEAAVGKRVEQLFNDETVIHRIIENKIAAVIAYGDKSWMGRVDRSFHAVVLDQIKKAVQEEVTKKLNISVTLDGKSLPGEIADEKNS